MAISRFRTMMLAGLGAILVSGLSLAAEKPIPRFALEVGQELRYEVSTATWADGPDGKPQVIREKDGTPKYERQDLSVFVTARNSDGSHHVILKRTSWAGYPILTCAEIFPDGRLVRDLASAPTLEEDSLRSVFPLLPPDGHETWQETEDRSDTRAEYRLDGGEIVGVFRGPLERVSEGVSKQRYRLDSQTNLPNRIQIDGYWKSYGETHESVVTLKQIERHDAAWAAEFHAEATKYFAVANKSKQTFGPRNAIALALATREVKGLDQILDRARGDLIAARDESRPGIFRENLKRLADDFDKYRGTRADTARANAKLAGEPSPDWAGQDLEGREHSLAAYRGKVVVLDFWFRQCTYCIRAMPQVEQAAAHLRDAGAPVVFLGISNDADPADARHVVKAVGLKMPVICDKKIAETYGIDRFPRLLVIDGQGKVRGIFSGYTSTLREELIASVNEAVKMQGKPTAATSP